MSHLKSKLIVAFFFILLTSFVTLVVVYGHRPEVDSLTNCQRDRQGRLIAVIILDQSDQFESGDIERARELTGRVLNSLDTDEKLLVLELRPDRPYEPTILFDRCAPKRSADWNVFFDSTETLKAEAKRFQDEFWKATHDAFARKELPKSPILETLGYAAARSDFKLAPSRRIYLFSDFLQNFSQLNFYKSVPDASSVSDDFLHLESVSLSSTTVYLILVARRSQWTTRPKVHTFWSDWLRARGANPEWQFSTESNRK